VRSGESSKQLATVQKKEVKVFIFGICIGCGRSEGERERGYIPSLEPPLGSGALRHD
jgi:hypothetical protein